MRQRKAPIGRDGKPVELHHDGQKPNGPIREMTQTAWNTFFMLPVGPEPRFLVPLVPIKSFTYTFKALAPVEPLVRAECDRVALPMGISLVWRVQVGRQAGVESETSLVLGAVRSVYDAPLLKRAGQGTAAELVADV